MHIKRLFSLMIILMPMVSLAQRSMNDFLEESCDIVWFGLDFSKARLIGEDGFSNPGAIKREYFEKWNHLMISEGDKYDWGKVLSVSDLLYDYSVVAVVNDQVDPSELVINKSYRLEDEDVVAAINAYQIEDYKEGIGVSVVVESFDKVKEQGFGYLVFFDITSRQLIYKHKLIGAAGSVGFRNHWARAIYNWTKYTRGRVMKDIKKEFKK